ncbi:MAG TPA: acetate/propionate family kinase [Solirubrobacteraceae bacterium]|nr:acetate/propionate family kinase [Solirubrobacteraceae bacterium]
MTSNVLQRPTDAQRSTEQPLRVLTVNAGSTGVRLRLLGVDDALLAEHHLDGVTANIDEPELRAALADGLDQADAVGHLVAHGGSRFHEPTAIDAHVEAALRELVDLAPLHQSKALAAVEAVERVLRRTPSVACFDTAFHATLPAHATTYALPASWIERWGVRRYGFQGCSHAWVARRVPELLQRRAAGLRIVSCHLGACASLCAIRDGCSVDTTMGFTPLDGLVMGTRSGSLDPGLLLWLMERVALTKRELAQTLEQRSGLQGLSGSSDMRDVLARAENGEEPAVRARDVYVHHLRAGIAAMAASLEGVDVLVFTGGVGEHSPAIRTLATAGLQFLGIELNRELNETAETDVDVSTSGAPARTFVIEAREDLEIARQVREALAKRHTGAGDR